MIQKDIFCAALCLKLIILMTIAPILMHHQITNTFNSKGNHAGHEITWKYPPYPWLFSTLQHFWEFFQTCIKPQHSASIPRWNKTLWRKLNLHVSHFCRTNSPTFISNKNHHIHHSSLFTKVHQNLYKTKVITFNVYSSFFISANLSSYSNYIFGTMDPDRTGVVTFEVNIESPNLWK